MEESVLDRLTFPADQKIFVEGEEGCQAFIVQSGMVEIFKTLADKKIVLGHIVKGGMFGEMALLDNAPRMASARAKTPVTVIVVRRKALEEKLARVDPFVRGLINILVGNIRSLGVEVGRPEAIVGDMTTVGEMTHSGEMGNQAA